MSRLMKTISFLLLKAPNRALSCTPSVHTNKYRIARGLPGNRNAEGVLTDGPDYTYLDGRPTPLLQKQKKRMLKQQEYADKIVSLCSELDFAKQRHQDIMRAKEQERLDIINDRLKPKGKALLKK